MDPRQRELRIRQELRNLWYTIGTNAPGSIAHDSARIALERIVLTAAEYCATEGKETKDLDKRLENSKDANLIRLHGALDSVKVGPKRFEY